MSRDALSRYLVRVRSCSALCGLVMLSSCGGDSVPGDEIACTTEARPGIIIHVFDAASGNPAGCGAKATVTAPGFSEVAQSFGTPCSDSTPIFAVLEKQGIYSVVVSKPGYQDFRVDNVVVSRDVCHVITVSIDARLSP